MVNDLDNRVEGSVFNWNPEQIKDEDDDFFLLVYNKRMYVQKYRLSLTKESGTKMISKIMHKNVSPDYQVWVTMLYLQWGWCQPFWDSTHAFHEAESLLLSKI